MPDTDNERSDDHATYKFNYTEVLTLRKALELYGEQKNLPDWERKLIESLGWTLKEQWR